MNLNLITGMMLAASLPYTSKTKYFVSPKPSAPKEIQEERIRKAQEKRIRRGKS